MDNYGTPKFPYIWKEIKKLINENVTKLKKVIDNESAELKTLIDNESAELTTLIDSKVSASVDDGSGTKSNVATGTTIKNLTTVSLPDVGVYVLIGLARFPANANGRRGLAWGSNSTGYFDNSLVAVPPVTESNGITRIQSMAIVTVTSAPLNVYLNCYHTAGTQLNVDYYWRYIKLA